MSFLKKIWDYYGYHPFKGGALLGALIGGCFSVLGSIGTLFTKGIIAALVHLLGNCFIFIPFFVVMFLVGSFFAKHNYNPGVKTSSTTTNSVLKKSDSNNNDAMDERTVTYYAGTYSTPSGPKNVVVYSHSRMSGDCMDELFRRHPGCHDYAITGGSDKMYVLKSRYYNAIFEEI
jgi:hypothetical protein